MNHATEFSVIIPTNNRPCVGTAVRSILANTGAPPFEIIVVGRDDDGALPDDPRVRLLADPQPTRPGALRNRGAAAARGAWLLFTDSDCVADADWLAGAHAAVSERRPVVGGAIRFPRGNRWDLGDNLAIFHALHVTQRPHVVATYLGTNNLALRKSLFDAVGGFNPALFPDEDWDLLNRLRQAGETVYFDPRFAVEHRSERNSPAAVREHARGYARGFVSMLRRGSDTGSRRRADRWVAGHRLTAAWWSLQRATIQTAGVYLRHPPFWRFLPALPAVWLFYYTRRREILRLLAQETPHA